MRMFSLVLVLCAACGKKPAAKAPASSEPPTVEERKDTSQPTDAAPAPTGASKPKGDPCSGGE